MIGIVLPFCKRDYHLTSPLERSDPLIPPLKRNILLIPPLKRGVGGFSVLFLILVFMVSGCGSPVYNPYTHISEIKGRPQEYQSKQVLVKGKVVETFAIPFLQKGMYQMDDGTDTIWIVPQGRVPFRGEEVTVKGKVKTGFTIRKRTFGTVIVEEVNESKNTGRK